MEITAYEDELFKKHRQERKDLQAKIQSMKKSVSKGDKKRKKEVTDEIAKLEVELDKRQAAEMDSFKPSADMSQGELPVIESVPDLAVEGPPPSPDAPRVSRAAKRRTKKAQEDREREKRILEQAEINREGPRVTEINAITGNLKHLGLALYNIPADGNCLYCAVNHQLETTGRDTFTVSKLRKLTAEFMRQHKDEFMPFMYNESDESVSEEYFESYCKEVGSTKLWGGQLELRALSNILQCPIKVIQANGPPTLQGENFQSPELILSYHRHLYRLGEHYNSTVPLNQEEPDDSSDTGLE